MSKKNLNNVDLAWLRMETPVNPMMITVCLGFTGFINVEQLTMNLRDIVRRYRRFRQRIVRPNQPFRRAYWQDDLSDRVEDHLEYQSLRLPADDASVQELVNQKMNTRLDFEHPLWKITLVDNYPGGSLIIVRIHHCIGDGISLMQVLLQMTTSEALGAMAYSMSSGTRESQAAVRVVSSHPATSSPDASSKVISTGGAKYAQPKITDLIAAAFRITFRPADPPTLLKSPLGPVKKAVWTEPFNMSEVQQMAHARKSTSNDFLMAVTSGAIRRYMDFHHDNRRGNIRAFVMVNLRGRSIDEELGNKFGLVFLSMPLDPMPPLDRLEQVKRGMDSLKASAEYAASYLILKLLGQLPDWVERLAIRILDAKGTVVSTNVPGSRNQLYLAGAPIQSIIAWVPQSGRIGVGISFVSYNNQLVVGLNVDESVMPDPEKFLELFSEEYRSYQAVLSPETVSEIK